MCIRDRYIGGSILVFKHCADAAYRSRSGADAVCLSLIHIFEVDVLGTGELERVEVVKDNGEIYAPAVSGNRCRFTWADEDLTAGTHFYYLRVTQKDQHQAWSSPIWVDVQ